MLLKTPTWRRDHVQDLLDTSTAPTKKGDDKKTIAAHKFFKELVDADKKKHIQLERYYPKYTGAIELHSRMDLGFRWYIEAAIMANVSTKDIAKDIDLPADVVETYEELFFDVRKHLKKKDYIFSMIFFPAYRAGMHGRDFDTLWKMMAYHGSFNLVREFNSIHELSAESRKWLDMATRARLSKNAFTASQVISPNQYNSTEIIDSYVNLLKLEVDSTTQESEILKALEPLFGSINFTVTHSNPTSLVTEPRFIDVANVPPNPLAALELAALDKQTEEK